MAEPLCLAMTGASGAIYGLRLLECLIQAGEQVYFLASRPALMVVATETALQLPARPEAMAAMLRQRYGAAPDQLRVFGPDDWTAPVASGSAPPRAMVVCPCSSGSLAAIAQGISNTLVHRAADVMIKERRRLILVPRETPLSVIHLQNMLTLAQSGVTVLPASPAFYHHPKTIEDLVDFVVARVLTHLGIPQEIGPKWGCGD